MSALSPLELKQMSPSLLGIIWNDGHHSLYHVRNLRLNCRCAVCVDEWSREKKLDDASVAGDIKPRRIEPVGRYAFKFTWSDGHDTGFYTFEVLRRLCECPACKTA
jgi:DUF971 family protein